MLREKAREFIKRIGITNDIEFKDRKAFIFFNELIKNHPEKETKLADYNGKLCIVQNPINKRDFSLAFYKTNGKSETISWNSCIKGKPDTLKETITKALRDEIQCQIWDFKKNKKYCSVCKKQIPYDQMDIDHCGEMEFKDIAKKYLQNKSFKMSDFKKNPKTCQPNFCNRIYAKEWQEYHKKYSVLQCLCKQCHKDKTHNRIT